MLVFSQYTFALLAVLLDGELLAKLRTAASSALAARLFAARKMQDDEDARCKMRRRTMHYTRRGVKGRQHKLSHIQF